MHRGITLGNSLYPIAGTEKSNSRGKAVSVQRYEEGSMHILDNHYENFVWLGRVQDFVARTSGKCRLDTTLPVLLTIYRQPELEASTPPELLKVLDNIQVAYGGEEVFFDFEVLFERLRNATDPHARGPQPLLRDHYIANTSFFRAVEETAIAWYKYLACCTRVLDPTQTSTSITIDDSDSRIALEKVDEQFEKLSMRGVELIECWKETAEKLRETLNNGLPTDWVLRAESVVFPWSLNSKRRALCVDLPNIAKTAEWHLGNFRNLSQSLQILLAQVEMVRSGGAPGVHQYRSTVRKTILIALKLDIPFRSLFLHYRVALGLEFLNVERECFTEGTLIHSTSVAFIVPPFLYDAVMALLSLMVLAGNIYWSHLGKKGLQVSRFYLGVVTGIKANTPC
ncbi:hypothetical protein B0H19DRAFT_1289889 [Mycena capillaripes]|nr:hypothetical protein B0H19DRAFT_1289889 [Mycena capillaripes]